MMRRVMIHALMGPSAGQAMQLQASARQRPGPAAVLFGGRWANNSRCMGHGSQMSDNDPGSLKYHKEQHLKVWRSAKRGC